MKRLLFSVACLLWGVNLWAGPVTAEQARQKAVRFLQDRASAGARRAAPAKAAQMKVAATGRDDSYYIFNVADNGGFVVVSGDDATEEILGYSDSGNITPDSIPCNMQMLLYSYAEQIEFLRAKGVTRTQNSSRKKTPNLGAGLPYSYTIAESRRSYFGQFSPFNDSIHCINGTPAPTGCQATAMAGLMFAHQWPKKTISEIPRYRNLKILSGVYSGERVEGAPSHTKIDWKNIKQQYNGKENDDQKAAIATLMRLAAISVKTAFTPTFGDADLYDADDALRDYFAYDDDVMWAERAMNDNQKTNWELEVRSELLRNGPVLYRGRSKTNGNHAFLIEGYTGNYFIINFGWSGQHHDETFLLSVIEGEDLEKLIDFHIDQQAVFYVKPIPHTELEVTSIYLDQGDFTEYTITETSLQGRITFHNKGNAKSSKFMFLQLTDVETGKNQFRITNTNIAPDQSETYHFSFTGLTIGHHYVVSALDMFGDEFYHSAELLCVDSPAFVDAEDDSGLRKLTRFEYWFDNDYKSRQSITLSKSETVVRDNLDTNQLDDGTHRLNYRVCRDDGSYSAISSSTFVKLSKEEKGYLTYWIDDDRDKMETLDLASTDDDQLLELDLADVTPGYHRLNIQVAMAGSTLGTVYTTGVMKLATAPANQLEYWFDDNMSDRKLLTGKRAEGGDTGFIYTEEIDMSSLEPGFHRLNLRPVSGLGQNNGAVLTRPVLKLSNAVADHLEYWFDGDMANTCQLSGKRAEGGESGYIYDCDLDLSSLSQGLHRLSLRATSSDGTNKSTVVNSSVLKLSGGDVTTLEYWFDGNRKDVRTMTGRQAEGGSMSGFKGCIFTNELNLQGIEPGHHRLYYRGIGADGNAATAVSMASVVVKVERPNQEQATMVSYTLTLDDDIVVAEGTLTEAGETEFNYVLDTAGLTEATHTLTATFWNSFGESVTQETQFYAGDLGLNNDGDVNGDGSVDVGDIMNVINCMAGISDNADKADVNGDGTIDVGDIMAIINKMAGL